MRTYRTTGRSLRLLRAFREEQPRPHLFYGPLAEDTIAFLEHFTSVDGAVVADVGSGPVQFAQAFADRGARYVGFEVDAHTLNATESTAGVVARGEQLPLAEGSVDIVLSSNVLEHVPDPAAIVQACFDLLKPGGVCVLSTINRNPKAYLFAIIGAEYVLRLLDRGTHDYSKFITPAELDKMAVNAGFNRQDLIGLHYNPITKRYWLAQNVDVNYMMAVYKPQ